MNSNNIEITQILGTDSLSSSRIVINDNFKILVNALNNYQNFFDENGVYSSRIISKDATGKIEFLSDTSNPSIMTLTSEKVTIDLPLEVGGNSKFNKILVNELTKNNSDKITISSDVEIQGNLTVSGSSPSGGGSSETILSQKYEEFVNNARDGYEKTYNKGCCIIMNDRKISLRSILNLASNMTVKTIMQYIHKPFVFTYPGAYIELDAEIEKITTNGVIRDRMLIPNNVGAVTTIKVYPAIIDNTNILFDIQFSSTPR